MASMNVEFLLAFDDNTWTTEVHEVKYKETEYYLPKLLTNEFLIKWAEKNIKNDRIVLHAVYGFPSQEEE